MKFKKLFASALAIAMAATIIPATPAKADVIDGSAAWVNTEVYDIVLPTTNTQKFYLDPQGLSGFKDGAISSNKGTIYVPDDLPAMTAINNSAKTLDLTIDYALKVNTDEMDVITATTASSIATVNTKPAIAMEITATPTTAKTVTVGGISSPTSALTSEALAVPSSKAGIAQKVFECEEATYDIVTKAGIDYSTNSAIYMNPKNYDLQMAASGGAIDFSISGLCRESADYSKFTSGAETMELYVVFTFTKASAEKVEIVDASANATLDQWPKIWITLPNGATNASLVRISTNDGAFETVDKAKIDSQYDGVICVDITDQVATPPTTITIRFVCDGVTYDCKLY